MHNRRVLRRMERLDSLPLHQQNQATAVDGESQETFPNRMRGFEARRAPKPGEAAVSIKVRVTSGCFHREHSPRAYELIDRSLAKLSGSDDSFAFEEHESGPEIL